MFDKRMALAILGAVTLVGVGVGFIVVQKEAVTPADVAPVGEAGAEPDSPDLGFTFPPAPSQPAGARLPPYRGAAVEVLRPDQKFLAQVEPAIYGKSKAELADLALSLGENPLQPELWKRVAYIKHFYGDEIGTRDAYEYLNQIALDDPIPYYNLALVYAYYLGQPAQAIPKFEAALRLDPVNAEFHIGFANFHRELFADLAASEAALLTGLGKLPGNINLTISLASLYRMMGNAAKAIAYYEQALAHSDLPPQSRMTIAEEVKRLKAGQGN